MPTRFSGSAAASVTDSCASWLAGAGAQRFDGYWQRELLAEKAADETAAADLALIFEAAEGDQQFAPARQNRFARNHFAEDDAVAAQQHPAGCFRHARAIGRLARVEQRPAADAVTRARAVPAALARAAFRIDQRANIVEAVGGDHSRGHQLPQRGFDFSFQFSGGADDIGEERCAALAQMREHFARGRA